MTEKLECPNCGAPLDNIQLGIPITSCKYCHTSVLLPAGLSSPGKPGITAAPGNILGHAQDLRRMVELARSGKQVEGIRIFREVFDTSLAEGKRAIDAIAAGQPVIMPGSSPSVTSSASQSALLQQIAHLYENVSALEAIELFKETYGISLKDSKMMVEKLAAGEEISLPDGTVFQLTRGITDLTAITDAVDGSGSDKSTRMVKFLAIGGLALGILAVVIGAIIGISQETRLEPQNTVLNVVPALPSATATEIPFASPVLTFGGEGTGAGLFSDAREIGVDAEGNIYVGDFETRTIQVFDQDGKFLKQWFTGDRDDGYELNILGLAATLDGRVFIASVDGLYEFDGLSGERKGKLTYEGDGYFEDVCSAPDGSLLAVYFNFQENIIRFDDTGQINLFLENPIGNVTDHSELDTSVAVDGIGNIFLLGSFNNLAFIYNRAGNYQSKFGGDGEGPGTFHAVGAIAVDNQSRIYISDIDGVQVFDPNGRYLDVFNVSNGVREMIFDLAGNLYTVDYQQHITRYRINQ
jgi:ribosomal protein L7/L12